MVPADTARKRRFQHSRILLRFLMATMRQPTVLPFLPPSKTGLPRPPTNPVGLAVNDNDVVVGLGLVGVDQNPRPFVWQPGQTVGTDLGVLTNNCVSVQAQGINNLGQIVGVGTQCLPNPNVAWFLQNGQTTPTLADARGT
jgi:hypothetical protein